MSSGLQAKWGGCIFAAALAAGSLTGKLEATIEITVRWGNICRPDFLGDVWLAQVQNNVKRILDKLQGRPPASLLVLVR